jgi:hypothetical protein
VGPSIIDAVAAIYTGSRFPDFIVAFQVGEGLKQIQTIEALAKFSEAGDLCGGDSQLLE